MSGLEDFFSRAAAQAPRPPGPADRWRGGPMLRRPSCTQAPGPSVTSQADIDDFPGEADGAEPELPVAGPESDPREEPLHAVRQRLLVDLRLLRQVVARGLGKTGGDDLVPHVPPHEQDDALLDPDVAPLVAGVHALP
eukprot:CAMPEP_0175245092 /NCGR_PEP_ID=MMETSP0093-20121207/32417_1 /TAXON_ID=311494 /ORGANISM="Alexandrium monilatum, Strain CCMP3105" /LENGTH=137 /DNA_ID=CAMNT_0016539211 /DNA_START=171 /DNA_END=586 /DNA_ORIENTATION=-